MAVTIARPVKDLGAARVLISMKYATNEVMVKNGLVRLNHDADMTVTHANHAANGYVTLETTTNDLPFGICMNDKEAGLNTDGTDMVDVLVFTKSTVIAYTVPNAETWKAQDVKGVGTVIKGATSGNEAHVLV